MHNMLHAMGRDSAQPIAAARSACDVTSTKPFRVEAQPRLCHTRSAQLALYPRGCVLHTACLAPHRQRRLGMAARGLHVATGAAVHLTEGL